MACTHQHSIALHSGLHVPPISSLPQFYSSVSHSLLNPLWRLRGIPLRIHGVLVLPTRKVQSLRAYKHLRLLTGTPCLTRVIQTSLFRAISDILRDANSGFMEHSTEHLSPPHPELMIITTAWLCLCSHHNLENLLSEAPPTMLNIQIPAKIWKNTMQVIRLRTVPTRTEGPVPMDLATAMPSFTQGPQGSVCRNAFPLLPTL